MELAAYLLFGALLVGTVALTIATVMSWAV